jgi:hypothetical protein
LALANGGVELHSVVRRSPFDEAHMADKTLSASELLLKDTTLRDFAALEFMKALIASHGVVSAESDAERAYYLADSLLAEREKRQELRAEIEAVLEKV